MPLSCHDDDDGSNDDGDDDDDDVPPPTRQSRDLDILLWHRTIQNC